MQSSLREIKERQLGISGSLKDITNAQDKILRRMDQRAEAEKNGDDFNNQPELDLPIPSEDEYVPLHNFSMDNRLIFIIYYLHQIENDGTETYEMVLYRLQNI